MDAGNASRPTSRAFRGKTLGRITGAQSLRQFDAVDEARALNVAALNSFRGFGHHDGTRPQRIRVDRDCRCARSLHPPDRWGRHCTAAMVIVSRCFISPSEQVPKQWSASWTLDHGQPGPAGGFLAGRGKHNSTRASTGAVAHVTRTRAEDKGSRPGVESLHGRPAVARCAAPRRRVAAYSPLISRKNSGSLTWPRSTRQATSLSARS